jgi:hypothetical protein
MRQSPSELIADFTSVAALAGMPISAGDIRHEAVPAPHKSPRFPRHTNKDFIRLRQKAGASNSNINHALRLLRSMFWLQVEESRMPSNLVPHFPLLKSDRPREDFLSSEEYGRVLSELRDDLKPLLIVAYHSGVSTGGTARPKIPFTLACSQDTSTSTGVFRSSRYGHRIETVAVH